MVNWTSVYLIVDENPNCGPEERVFSTSGEKKSVKKLHLPDPKSGTNTWCDVAAVEENGNFGKAFAQRVEDSSDGTAWLVFGGTWGLRLKPSDKSAPWSLKDETQWGLPFVVLDSSGTSIEFS